MLRVVGRHELRDHAAHRDADDVGLLDPERIQEADCILRHVVERVRQRRGLAGDLCLDDRPRVGDSRLVKLGGEADVAVIVDDDPVAPPQQLLDELDGPGGKLRAVAHDQEHRLMVLGTELLVGDRDAVRLDFTLASPGAGRIG